MCARIHRSLSCDRSTVVYFAVSSCISVFLAAPCPPSFQVLATNHVFDILIRAMASEGDLEKIEHQTLPPRKRAGWTGGDDRGPSSKSTTKPARDPEKGQEAGGVPGTDDSLVVGASGESGTNGEGIKSVCESEANRTSAETGPHSGVVSAKDGVVTEKDGKGVEEGGAAVGEVGTKRAAEDEDTDVDAKRAKTIDGDTPVV